MTTENEPLVEEVISTTEEPSNPQSEEAPAEPSVEGTGLEFDEPDFDAITEFVENDEDEVIDVEPTEEVAEEAPAEEAPVEEPLVEEVVSEEAPVEEPVEAEEAPVEEAAAVEDAPEPVVLPTKEELEGMYTKHREETLPKLTELFQLTEEEANALDEAPSKMVPELAGRMMYDTMLSTYNAVMAALPSVIQTHTMATRQADEAQNVFYDAWPDLKGQEHVPAVSAAITAYRTANPRAPMKDVIKNAGVMAMINLGKDPLKQKTEQVAPKTPVAQPARPASPRGTTQVTPPKPKGQEENMFAAMTDAIIAENS